MTSLDNIDLDEMQDLSIDEQNILSTINPRPYVVAKSSTTWYPIILAVVVTVLAFLVNTDWVQNKLQDIPYAKYAMYGILLAVVLLSTIFIF